jgi:hypothetical protein
LLLHGPAHGYGVELDRVKVAKAEAFCRGVIDELASRGVLHSSNNNSGKEATKGPAAVTADIGAGGVTAAAAAEAGSGAGGGPGDAAGCGPGGDVCDVTLGSQGSCLGSQQEPGEPAALAAAAAAAASDDNASDDTQVLLDCSQTALVGPTAAAAAAAAAGEVPEHKQQQTGAAVKKSQATAAAAAAGGVPKGGVKAKGPGLLWPASRPIITCAAIEQVGHMRC